MESDQIVGDHHRAATRQRIRPCWTKSASWPVLPYSGRAGLKPSHCGRTGSPSRRSWKRSLMSALANFLNTFGSRTRAAKA